MQSHLYDSTLRDYISNELIVSNSQHLNKKQRRRKEYQLEYRHQTTINQNYSEQCSSIVLIMLIKQFLATSLALGLLGIVTNAQTQSNFQCRSEGFFVDPNDCSKFVRCVDTWQTGRFQVYTFDCPDGKLAIKKNIFLKQSFDV